MPERGTSIARHHLNRRMTIWLSALMCWLSAAATLAATVYPTQPAGRDGLLCFSGSGVTCFSPATMEKRWYALTETRTFAPSMTATAVIVGSSSGLRALDSSNGSVRWQWQVGGEVYSPAVDSHAVYATSRQGRIAALDPGSGDVLWERQLDGWLYTPALIPDLAITGGRAGVVFALDRGTGATVWTRELDQELVFRPVAVDDGVVVTTFSGSIVSLDRSGAVRWRKRDAVPSFSPTVAGDLLVFGGMDGVLRAREIRTGVLRWDVELSGRLTMPARAHDGQVAVVSSDGLFAVIDAADGAVLARVSIPGNPLGSPVWSRQGAWRVFQRESGIISWVDAS